MLMLINVNDSPSLEVAHGGNMWQNMTEKLITSACCPCLSATNNGEIMTFTGVGPTTLSCPPVQF